MMRKHNLTGYEIPRDYKEALTDTQRKQAMDDEMAALQRNNTWDLVELPQVKETVGCK